MVMINEIQKLEVRRKKLISQLSRHSPWIMGSIGVVQRICGTKGCACRRGGAKHPAMYITWKEKEKTVSLYVPRKLESQAREWSQNYKTLKGLISALSDVQKQIIQLRD